MRGEILEITGEGAGLVSGDDGQRYRFAARDVTGFLPHRGDRIDFVGVDGVATEIVLLSSGPVPLREAFGYRTSKDTGPTTPWGYFVRCMRKYVDGHGRATRSEYWWFILFRTLLVGPAYLVGMGLGMSNDGGTFTSAPAFIGFFLAAAGGIIFLGTILPMLVVTFRRLHDVGQSGWLILLNLIPYVGGLVILVFTLLPSQEQSNEYGPNPLQPTRDQADVFA